METQDFLQEILSCSCWNYFFKKAKSNVVLEKKQLFKVHSDRLDRFNVWSLSFYCALSDLLDKTCPKGFGLKLAKLGLKIPLKNKVKQKQS